MSSSSNHASLLAFTPVSADGTVVIKGRLMVSTDCIVRNDQQPREYFDKSDLEQLGNNIKAFGQEKPIILMPIAPYGLRGMVRFMIVDGERRWRACSKIGCLVWAVVEESTIKDPGVLFERSLNANYPQAPLTIPEIIRSIKRLADNGRTIEQMATIFGKSIFWINVHKRVSTLHPKVLKMLDPNIPEDERIPLMHASDLADLPHDRQLGLAEMIVVGGLSRAHLKNLIRMAQLDRITPNTNRSRPDREFLGVVSLFVRLNDRLAFLASQQSEVKRIADGRSKKDIARLLQNMEQAKRNIETLLESFGKSVE